MNSTVEDLYKMEMHAYITHSIEKHTLKIVRIPNGWLYMEGNWTLDHEHDEANYKVSSSAFVPFILTGVKELDDAFKMINLGGSI